METIIFVLVFLLFQILLEKIPRLANLSLKQVLLIGIPLSVLAMIISGILVNRILLILFFAVFGSLIVGSMRKSQMLQIK
jgi:hypothetical protein